MYLFFRKILQNVIKKLQNVIETSVDVHSQTWQSHLRRTLSLETNLETK
jgi:hypothetical protein